MSNVKWIKLSTNMFEDEKIRLIEQMPEADTILIIWVKLLSQAGKTNASGYIYLSENIPYTEEMLAAIFNRPLGIIRLALETFKTFGMIEVDDNSFIGISNWEKHQNTDALEKIRKDTRKRVAKHREKKKLQKKGEMLQKENKKLHVTNEKVPEANVGKDLKKCNVTVAKSNATEEERRKKKKKEEEEKEQQQTVAEIIQFWDNNGFGFNNINAKNQLLSWLDDSSFSNPKSMILKALDIACANDKRRLNYVQGILKNWENESLLTVEEVESNDNGVRGHGNGYAGSPKKGTSYDQAMAELAAAKRAIGR